MHHGSGFHNPVKCANFEILRDSFFSVICYRQSIFTVPLPPFPLFSILCSTSSHGAYDKVRTLSDEAANRKAFVDSLKRRLSVATKEKNEHELSSQKLRTDLDRKVCVWAACSNERWACLCLA